MKDGLDMDPLLLGRVRAQLPKVKVPSSYSRVYKDECTFTFAGPESDGGIFINLESWYCVGSRYLDLEHERSGNVLYLNVKHHRVPISDEHKIITDQVPKKMAIGGEDGFQVNKKKYNIEKESALVLMPERTVIQLPCPELPELLLNAIAGIEVRNAVF
jgi:ubiquitin carboxyl-terminal hydrolase 5/13